MNFQIISNSFPLYIEAFWTTLKLGVVGIAISLILGFLLSLIRYFKIPVISHVLQGYIEIARNTPLLIQLFFLYYGLPKIGITMTKEVIAIIGLSFLGTAYMVEAFVSAYQSIPEVQLESAKALGFSRRLIALEILFPQGLPVSIASVGANMIFLLKETSVFSAIAILDLTNTTRNLIGMYYRTSEYLILLVIGYIVLILPFVIILSLIERRIRRVRI